MTVTKRNYNGTLSRNYFFAIALGDFSVDFLSSWDNSFFCSSGLLYESCESWVFRPKPEVEKIKVLRRFSQTVQVGPVETFLMANCIGKSSPISLLFLFSCESFFVENSFFLEIEIAFYFSSITGIRLIHDWWINIARRINKMVSIYVWFSNNKKLNEWFPSSSQLSLNFFSLFFSRTKFFSHPPSRVVGNVGMETYWQDLWFFPPFEDRETQRIIPSCRENDRLWPACI